MCKIFIMCTELFVRGSVKHKLGEWSLPNTKYALERATFCLTLNSDKRHHYVCTTFTPERCKPRPPNIPPPVKPNDKF